jgi:hypothetical protein
LAVGAAALLVAAEARPAVLSQAARPEGTVAGRPNGAQVVLMEPYTVRDTARLAKLGEDIQRAHAAAASESRMRTLGVGVREVSLGIVHLDVGTAFYILFAIWSGTSGGLPDLEHRRP